MLPEMSAADGLSSRTCTTAVVPSRTSSDFLTNDTMFGPEAVLDEMLFVAEVVAATAEAADPTMSATKRTRAWRTFIDPSLLEERRTKQRSSDYRTKSSGDTATRSLRIV